MTACSRGHYRIVKYLIDESFVDIFFKNFGNEMAYDISASNFESDICEILTSCIFKKCMNAGV